MFVFVLLVCLCVFCLCVFAYVLLLCCRCFLFCFAVLFCATFGTTASTVDFLQLENPEERMVSISTLPFVTRLVLARTHARAGPHIHINRQTTILAQSRSMYRCVNGRTYEDIISSGGGETGGAEACATCCFLSFCFSFCFFLIFILWTVVPALTFATRSADLRARARDNGLPKEADVSTSFSMSSAWPQTTTTPLTRMTG